MTATSSGLRRVAKRLSPDPAPDGELLHRFLTDRDEDAFATVVRRHGPMVLGTCRRVLGNATDADDAFQATFVVLVRKAHSLADRATIGNFLYGVAYHTALKAKAMAAKRRTKESHAKTPEPAEDQSELLSALDEELARLPEKYREPVVLCELEGRSRREAAESLDIPEGTISSRLSTAHRMLEKRLKSRGFGAVCVSTILAGQAFAVTDSLANAAVRSASIGPSEGVSNLVSEVSKMLLLHKIGIGATALVVAAVGVGIAFALPRDIPANDPPIAPKATEPLPLLVKAAAADEKEPAWKVEFRKVYGLKDGELIRRVAPPYPECRAEYFRDEIRELYKRNKMDPPEKELKHDYTKHFTKFAWKDGWTVPELRRMVVPVKPDEGISLAQLLDMTTGFHKTRIESEREAVLKLKVTGDFVVRAGADPEKIAEKLGVILHNLHPIVVSLSFKDVERDVYVFSGKYKAKPLPDRKENEIEVYASQLQDKNSGGGGGSGSVKELIGHIERFVNHPVMLGEVEGAKRVSWHYNYRSPFTEAQYAEDRDPDAVVNNIADQTGLTVKREKRKIRVLVVDQKP
ncbi:MAG: sigma-70 family RNA polymerase sigma factor [Planctomycetia bacterium]|nr:sigma-70 family RNA polymerase sigma factor [Planctomycetia bacterium]